MRVSSILGESSRFKLKVPVKVVAKDPDTERKHMEHKTDQESNQTTRKKENDKDLPLSETTFDSAPSHPEQMRFLVAEDNRANRMLIKTMLKSADHAIFFAEDSVQAVARYMENRPDFVLMDLSMPNKNGFDATREIRALEQKDSL